MLQTLAIIASLLTGQAIGHAKRGGGEIVFLFKGTDTWLWTMDGEEGGKLQPFARVRLTRK